MNNNQRVAVDPLGVLFVSESEGGEGFVNAICGPATGEYILVDNLGYQILKTIDKYPGILLTHLLSLHIFLR